MGKPFVPRRLTDPATLVFHNDREHCRCGQHHSTAEADELNQAQFEQEIAGIFGCTIEEAREVCALAAREAARRGE
jgi:hypothetical protein